MDDTRTLEALRLLLNFESGSEPALTLLLVGQPGLLPQIDRMPALEERLGVKCLLRPFNVDETAGYMNFRLQAAGAKSKSSSLPQWKLCTNFRTDCPARSTG